MLLPMPSNSQVKQQYFMKYSLELSNNIVSNLGKVQNRQNLKSLVNKMSRIQTVFVGDGEIGQDELVHLKEEDIRVMTARRRRIESIELLCGEINLQWLDLRDNLIQDSELHHLSRLHILQVLLLDSNLINDPIIVIESLKSNATLTLLSLLQNPLWKSEASILTLKDHFKANCLNTSSLDQSFLGLKKQCLLLQIKSQRKDNELRQLRKELFEDKSQDVINLGRYLTELRVYYSSYPQIIHTLFLTLKRMGKQKSQVREIYHNLPWHIIMEWPEKNFITQNKIYYEDVQQVLEHESIQYSTNLEVHLENMLNHYYAAELANLFGVCKAKISYFNLNGLLEFLLSTCRQYFFREEEEYQEWIKVVFPFPVDIKQELMKYLLEGGLEKITTLQVVLNKAKHAEYTKEERRLLNEIKRISFNKVFQLTSKQASNKSFPRLIMQFFSSILNLYTEGVQLITDNKRQNILFAKFLFREFDSSDVYYLSLLVRQGEMRNEEYFLNNVMKLGQIVNTKSWLDSIQEAENKLKTIQFSEINLALSVFLKKVLGRPEFNIGVIKKYFSGFDFEVIEKLVDCHERPQLIELLSNRFGSDFSFIRESIIARKQNPNFRQMKQILSQNKVLISDQNLFVERLINLFVETKVIIQKNPFFSKIVNDIPTSFSLLQGILSIQPNSVHVDEIIETTNEDKLYSLENRYLLEMLRQVIRVDDKTLQLVNRQKCWFADHLHSMKGTKFYQKSEYLFDFIRFTYTLYLQNLQQKSPSTPHKNLLNHQQISKGNNLKQYLQKINPKYILSDYLLGICQQEVRNLVFIVQQGVLTFEMLKFRELAKNPTCKYCFDEDFYEELELIANTNGIYYVEVHGYDKDKFNDKKLRQALLQSYHELVLLHCLKKQLMNFGEYSVLLEKAEKMAKVKGFQLKLPLYQISRVVRTDVFHKSTFKTELFKFLKSKKRQQDDRNRLITLFAEINQTLKNKEVEDKRMFQFIKEMFSLEQNRICEVFISNISLISSVELRLKSYPILDWEQLDSFAAVNYLAHWRHPGIPEIQERMDKYKRVLYRYLSNPLGFKGEKGLLNRATDKLQDLILTQQINAMLGSIFPIEKEKKKGLTLTFHLIHQSLKRLEEKGDVEPVEGFNYQICLSIKKKLGHRGFLTLTDYFQNGVTFQNKDDVEETIEMISYKIEYYKSLNVLKHFLLEREYNPRNYFNTLLKTLLTLSNINILNTEIEIEFIRTRYPRFPWPFIVMTSVLEPGGMWYRVLQILEEEYGIYLQLLHYFDTRDQTDGIIILRQLFEAIYSDVCCNDLLQRIIPILKPSERLREIANQLLTSCGTQTLDYQSLQKEITFFINTETKSDFVAFDKNELVAYLRVVSLKGEYLNRIEKSSNRLRNMLCDYDEQGVDLNYFLTSHLSKQSQIPLRQALLQTLKISLKYKSSLFSTNYNNFFRPFPKSTLVDKNNSKLIIEYLSSLNYKKQYITFKEPDLHLHFILLSEPKDVRSYFKDMVELYKSMIKGLDFSQRKSSEWQASEFLQVAILTIIRLKTKYKMVVEGNPEIELALSQQPHRIYRNHLAHYIPGERMLAAKKLKVEGPEDVHGLNLVIHKMISSFKL